MQKHFFLLLACGLPLFGQSAAIFDDVSSFQGFYYHANMLRLRFITMGCTYVPSRFCPNDNLTRGQAAVFVIRGLMTQ